MQGKHKWEILGEILIDLLLEFLQESDSKND